jgi:transcriptional regulator with XRE-family HTH domain
MTDRIKYNEATGKVEVDADVWDMIVGQMPGQSILDEVKARELWDETTSREVVAEHLRIASNTNYRVHALSGVKNKIILSAIYPECIISLTPTIQSKHEFRKDAFMSMSKAELATIKDNSIRLMLSHLLSGRKKNPWASTVWTLSKITGIPVQNFITSVLPTTTTSTMSLIKQRAMAEKTNILSTVIREFKLTGVGLAKEVGVTSSSVSHWSHGKAPRLDAYVALCKYFNVPFDYFSDWLE